MVELIITLALGIASFILGIIHINGNISSLHKYHRHRVTEENKKPFGRLVGIGSIILGLSFIIMGIMTFISKKIQIKSLLIIADSIFVAGLIADLIISFYAMKKYNKGIF